MIHFSGVITALVTPFKENALDLEGLSSNVIFQIKHGINGLLVLGTTGEISTLSESEQKKVLEVVVKKSQGKVPIYVNIGDNCTWKTIEKAQVAEQCGANVLLAVTPYYNRPTQEGLFSHFNALARSTSLPIILYHHPPRTGVSLSFKTVERLINIPNIVGIKEASSNFSLIAQMLHAFPKEFSLLSGDDCLTLPLLALGGKGVISVLSNLLPGPMLKMVNLAREGGFEEARKWHDKLFSYYGLTTLETNPAPIKAMMHEANLFAGPCRLPLSPLSEGNLKTIKTFFPLTFG